MRTTFALIVSLAISCLATTGHAGPGVRQVGKLGLGLGAGTFATGLSAKYFLDRPLAVQGNVGWWRNPYYCTRNACYGGGDSLSLSADLLFEQAPFAGNAQVQVAWAIGGGVGFGIDDFDNQVGLGAAFVAGLEINVDVIPLDVVIEYRPGFVFLPGFAIDAVNFTGHVRYYF